MITKTTLSGLKCSLSFFYGPFDLYSSDLNKLYTKYFFFKKNLLYYQASRSCSFFPSFDNEDCSIQQSCLFNFPSRIIYRTFGFLEDILMWILLLKFFELKCITQMKRKEFITFGLGALLKITVDYPTRESKFCKGCWECDLKRILIWTYIGMRNAVLF